MNGLPSNVILNGISPPVSLKVCSNQVPTDMYTGPSAMDRSMATNNLSQQQDRASRAAGGVIANDVRYSTASPGFYSQYGCGCSSVVVPLSGYPCMYFDGTEGPDLNGTRLVIPNDADLRMGTGDFTIEWFQKMTYNHNNPRIFWIGDDTDASIGLTIEFDTGDFLYWANYSGFSDVGSINIFDEWAHIAICRSGTTTRIFVNGTQLGSDITDTTDYNEAIKSLTLGQTTDFQGVNAEYTGYITNFHWVKGTALYPTSASFTVPTVPLSPVANTKLLLRAASSGSLLTDSSASPKTVTNYGVTWANV